MIVFSEEHFTLVIQFSCLQREESEERRERRAISWRPSSASRVRDSKITPKRELFLFMLGEFKSFLVFSGLQSIP